MQCTRYSYDNWNRFNWQPLKLAGIQFFLDGDLKCFGQKTVCGVLSGWSVAGPRTTPTGPLLLQEEHGSRRGRPADHTHIDPLGRRTLLINRVFWLSFLIKEPPCGRLVCATMFSPNRIGCQLAAISNQIWPALTCNCIKNKICPVFWLVWHWSLQAEILQAVCFSLSGWASCQGSAGPSPPTLRGDW